MADPATAVVAATALEAARQRVSALSDILSNTRTIAIFDETKGAVQYTRWRREITQAATNAGQVVLQFSEPENILSELRLARWKEAKKE